MRNHQFTKRLARASRRSLAKAADEVDEVVHQILRSLRKGSPADLPGLGTFSPGKRPVFRFHDDSKGQK